MSEDKYTELRAINTITPKDANPFTSAFAKELCKNQPNILDLWQTFQSTREKYEKLIEEEDIETSEPLAFVGYCFAKTPATQETITKKQKTLQSGDDKFYITKENNTITIVGRRFMKLADIENGKITYLKPYEDDDIKSFIIGIMYNTIEQTQGKDFEWFENDGDNIVRGAIEYNEDLTVKKLNSEIEISDYGYDSNNFTQPINWNDKYPSITKTKLKELTGRANRKILNAVIQKQINAKQAKEVIEAAQSVKPFKIKAILDTEEFIKNYKLYETAFLWMRGSRIYNKTINEYNETQTNQLIEITKTYPDHATNKTNNDYREDRCTFSKKAHWILEAIRKNKLSNARLAQWMLDVK